ncbi:aldo/keto reductase [Microbacterium sp. Be9]|uniref:aldo/keto reductase n=1 Tax=Microbacterium sp. Be9 TaxID=2720211 RepID=UPI0032642C3F
MGLGTSTFGNLYRQTTDDQVEGAFASSWAGGIRYFDTAPHYGLGLSEQRLGTLLRQHPRDEVIVSSKVGRILEPSPDTADRADAQGFAVPAATVRRFDFSRDGILRSIEESLLRTGLDRFDVLYLHDPEDHWEQAATSGISTLIELRDQGVVSAVGAGMNYAAPLAELIRRADVDLVMIAGQMTLLEHAAFGDLLPLALDRGVGIVAAGVYNSGILGRDRPVPDAKFNYADAPTETIVRADLLATICEAHGVSLPVAAIAYPLLHPAVASVVLGARDSAQAVGNLARYRTPVPDALWSELQDAGLIPEISTDPSERTP